MVEQLYLFFKIREKTLKTYYLNMSFFPIYKKIFTIKNKDYHSIMLYTVVYEDEYSIYNHNRSIYYGKFIWKYNYEGNSIRKKHNFRLWYYY